MFDFCLPWQRNLRNLLLRKETNEPRAKHEYHVYCLTSHIGWNLEFAWGSSGSSGRPQISQTAAAARQRSAAGGVRFSRERRAWSGGTVHKTETSFTFSPFSHNHARQRKALRQSYLPCDQSLTCCSAAGGQAVGIAMAWA
ncbi:hypothetical protein AOLI_G00030590 [Acnodon oligacanthus]